MKSKLSICGLNCSECGAYLAKKNNDDAVRIETANEWSKMFNAEIKPIGINCDGCLSKKGVLFSHCSVCEIRKCGFEKDVTNCSECNDYPCSKISQFHEAAPEAKENFDKLRNV